MPVLYNRANPPLPVTDAAGVEIHTGSTVRDAMFGDGIATGTVPIAGDEGVNVLIRWLG